MRLPVRIALEIGTLAVGCLFGAHASSPAGDLSFKVLHVDADHGVWLRPYVAPAFEFKETAGPAPDTVVEGCRIASIDTTYSDHADRRVILKCAQGVELQLRHVDFEN